MCLSIAIRRPHDVLAKGVHDGFDFVVTNNGMGYRCGYVRVPIGHPWHGKDIGDIDAEVHGGITFAEADMPCANVDKADDGWWFGFDCMHHCDAPDLALPTERPIPYEYDGGYSKIRTQSYVESECRSLCVQAEAACIPASS